jgi:phage major head subunit gpT-like protein
MLTSAQWAEALAPGIREWFTIGYENRPSLASRLFNVQTSESAYEEFMNYGVIAPDAWGLYETTGILPKVTFDKGYKATFTHKEYTLAVDIQRKLVDDTKYPQIMQLAQQLGDSAALKRELDAAALFNNADNSSYPGPDGVELCDASHPYSPTKSGTTQDNVSALTLSATNVETVRQAMLAVTDDTGNIAGVQPTLLLVPTALENDAKIITQTAGVVGKADNDVNPQAGRFNYLVWPYLTSATAWFMIDEIKMKQSLYWFDRVALDIHREVKDDTLFSTFIAYMRYSLGWTDWRWIHQGNA